MRIHINNTEGLLKAIAATIGKDPISLEGWRCLHVGYRENKDVEWYDKMLEYVQKANENLDCEVICCSDDNLLFISNSVTVDGLYALANMFIVAASMENQEGGEVALYDMYRDWREVKTLLDSKIVNFVAEEPTKLSSYNFGEVDSLAHVFDEAKKLRTARLPLRVMVVEDDALTRRIMENAFKDNYAVITASNAQTAVENYLMYAPDIVFLDIGLPDATGFDVLHQIVTTDTDAYIVMCSANSYLENVAIALSSGASGFISKPFKQEKMYRYIRESALHHRNCV